MEILVFYLGFSWTASFQTCNSSFVSSLDPSKEMKFFGMKKLTTKSRKVEYHASSYEHTDHKNLGSLTNTGKFGH